MPRTKQTFTREFKLLALQELEHKTAIQIGVERGLDPQLVRRWKREYELTSHQAFRGYGNRLKYEGPILNDDGSDVVADTQITSSTNERIETLEDRVRRLEEVVVWQFNVMAERHGDYYHFTTLEGPTAEYEGRSWSWDFAEGEGEGNQQIGELGFSIMVQQSREGNYIYPLLEFSYLNCSQHFNSEEDRKIHALELAVPKLARYPLAKSEVADVVRRMLESSAGILQVAENPITPMVSRLLYSAARQSVFAAYAHSIEQQRTHFTGMVLAAQAMRNS